MKKSITLATKEYVDKIKTVYLNIGNTFPADMSQYGGKALYVVNSAPVVINGVTINSWTHWYFPKFDMGDCFGIAIYPDATKFTIIGHTSSGFYAHKVY